MKLHRTLILASSLPFPSFSGFDLRVWQIVRALSALGPVGVFGICSNDPRAADPPPGVAVWRTSTDPALAYPPPSDQKVAARAWLFDPLGHPWDLLHSETATREIEALIREFRPTAFVAEGLSLHRYLPAMREHDFQLVLDCHNVETLVARELATSGFGTGLSAKLTRDVLPPRVAEIEKRATQNVDQLWVCSEADADDMRAEHGTQTPIHVVPNAIDVSRFASVRELRKARAHSPKGPQVFYPGMYRYEPNAIAAEYLIEEIFPRLLAKYPHAVLKLVGAWPTESMLAAAKREPQIRVAGAVPDIRPHFADADALVVPVLQGGGTRLKVLEAFAAMLPVVSTPKGVEGLDVVDGKQFLAAADPEAFVERAIELWSDPLLAANLSEAGFETVRRYYSWDSIGRCIEAAMLKPASPEGSG